MSKLLLAALAATIAVAPTAAVSAQSSQPMMMKPVLNLKDGLAMEGYDPVSYFVGSKPVKGSPAITAQYQGATYRFASSENRVLFAMEPAKYAPQYGGYCGYAASQGHLAPVDPEAYTIMNGRLILQNSKSVLQRWLEDPEGYLKKADENWPTIVAKEAKP